MNILILGLNYAPEPVGIGVYTSSTASFLSSSGHDVTVVCGKPYYPDWQVFKEYRRKGVIRTREAGVRVHRIPLYVPKEPTGLRRLMHHASFAARALPEMIRAALIKKPDLVFCVAPSLISAVIAKLISRIFKAKIWIHIQDFEVEAAFATNLLADRGLIARGAKAFQSWCLSQGTISTISPQMVAKLYSMQIERERVYEFRNWANINSIKPQTEVSEYKSAWQITTPFVALYSGNIGKKQGIEVIIRAARHLADRSDLTFVICGNGASKGRLKETCRGLSNVKFFELQPAEKLSELLALATVHLLPQIADAADLVLPSKMANMMASGRPILATAAPATGIANELEGCGLCVPPGDHLALANALANMLDDDVMRAQCGKMARARAEEHWGRDHILGNFVKEMTRRCRYQDSKGITPANLEHP